MGLNLSHVDDCNLREDNLGFPPEIVEKFVNYLSIEDRLVCRLVCHDWNDFLISSSKAWPKYSIAIEPRETSELQTMINHLISNPLSNKWSCFIFKSFIFTKESFNHLKIYSHFITTIVFYDISVLFIDENDVGAQEVYGLNQIEIEDENDDIAETSLLCPNLKSLSLTSSEKYFMLPAKNLTIHKIFCIKRLQYLNLSNNKNMTDYSLFSFLLKIDALNSINLSGLDITFFNAVFNRFYPQINSEPPETLSGYSDNVLTFKMLYMGYLATPRAKYLKHIYLDNTKINTESLQMISSYDNFQWESIGLFNTTEINETTIHNLVKEQIGLKNYSCGIILPTIPFVPFLLLRSLKLALKTNSYFPKMGDYMKELEVYYVKSEYNLNIGMHVLQCIISNLSKPSELKSLKLFKRFDLIHLIMPPTGESCAHLINISKLENLTTLCIFGINSYSAHEPDSFLQSIIKHLKKLIVLKLDFGNKYLTDFGVAGEYTDEDFEHPNQKISQLCKERFYEFKNSSKGLPLSSLKNLKELSLDNCNLLGHTSFRIGLNMPYLEKLSMINCSGSLTPISLKYIATNCKSLVEFIFNDRLNNKDFENLNLFGYLKSFLPRLRTINSREEDSYNIFLRKEIF